MREYRPDEIAKFWRLIPRQDRSTFCFVLTPEQRRRWASTPSALHRPGLIARIAAGLA